MSFTISELGVVLRELETFARDDASESPWALNAKLLVEEDRILHKGNEPLTFSHLCLLTLSKTSDPANRVLFKLGIVNGYRRVDETAAEAEQLFKELQQEIAALPDGPRKTYCEEFYEWQLAVFEKKQGKDAEAIERHRRSAASEAVSLPNRAADEYLVHFYTFCKSLMDADPAGISAALLSLETALPVLQDKVKGDAHHQWYWGALNGPMHLMQAWLFADSSFVGSARWHELLYRYDANRAGFGPRNTAWSKLFQAVGDAAGLQAVACSTKVMDDVKAAANLLLARMDVAIGQRELAKATYRCIKPVPNGQMIAAVAQRELAALGD